MRPLPLACLALVLAACDCGSYPAGAPGDSDDPPREVTCAGLPDTPPVALHELAAGERIRFGFSACGHLLAVVDDTDLLAAPDLDGLAPLAAGPADARHSFSPTGELLLRSGDEGSRLLDLTTGTELALAAADNLGFFPSRDLDRSILARCTESGIVVVDRGVERPLDSSARCIPYSVGAALAPVALATSAGERLLVVDLERGTLVDTGLPLVEGDALEPTPTGELGYRVDEAFVSPDGARVFHVQRWWVAEGDTMEYVGTGEVELVETRTGKSETFAGDGYGPAGIFRTGFLWSLGWEGTLFAGAAGDGELGLRCDHAEPYSTTGERVLISCYHASTYWHDHVFDSRTLTTLDLGDPWSVRTPSRNIRAIAGCPTDAWRGGSCTEPVVRRWVEGDEPVDLPLDRTADVAWVGDDGTVLAIATERDEGLLLDASGAVRTRFPLVFAPGPLPRILAAGEVLLVQAESLELLVPATGFHRRLADSCAWSALDPRGERVAFTVPDGDGLRLLAGAVPR